MAILGVEPPAFFPINETLRLRRFDGTADFALVPGKGENRRQEARV